MLHPSLLLPHSLMTEEKLVTCYTGWKYIKIITRFWLSFHHLTLERLMNCNWLTEDSFYVFVSPFTSFFSQWKIKQPSLLPVRWSGSWNEKPTASQRTNEKPRRPLNPAYLAVSQVNNTETGNSWLECDWTAGREVQQTPVTLPADWLRDVAGLTFCFHYQISSCGLTPFIHT